MPKWISPRPVGNAKQKIATLQNPIVTDLTTVEDGAATALDITVGQPLLCDRVTLKLTVAAWFTPVVAWTLSVFATSHLPWIF